jgi:hypothetical protein
MDAAPTVRRATLPWRYDAAPQPLEDVIRIQDDFFQRRRMRSEIFSTARRTRAAYCNGEQREEDRSPSI